MTNAANITDTELLAAYAAGIDAAEKNAKRIPIHNKVIMHMIRTSNAPLGSGYAVRICDAFQSGYQTVCDKQARAVA